MAVIKAFKNANTIKHQRDWDTLYILLDIHGTVMVPNWDGYSTEFYPKAIEALQEISKDKTYKIILWTCSKELDRLHYKGLLEERGIPIYSINENPDTEGKLNWGDYSQKLYCNVILDDKAGFDPHTDWQRIIDFSKNQKPKADPTQFMQDEGILSKKCTIFTIQGKFGTMTLNYLLEKYRNL